MSPIDPDYYQTEESSALQDVVNKAGKTASKKLAKNALQGVATKVAALAGSSIGLSVILGTVAMISDSRDDCYFLYFSFWWRRSKTRRRRSIR